MDAQPLLAVRSHSCGAQPLALMPHITQLSLAGRGGLLRLYLDGVFAFSIDADLARQENLKPGVELEADRVEALRRAAARSQVSEASWRLLAVRPRARAELRRRLLSKGLPEDIVDGQLDHLQERGYLDDAEFARAWVAMRQSGGAPRGAAALRAELRSKGVHADLAREAAEAGDEASAALRTAQKRAPALAALPEAEFRRR